MRLYNFNRLIKKYSAQFTLSILPLGAHIDGRYVKGEPTTKTMTGAIVPFTQRKIYRSGGYLTTADRQLYMTTRITESLEGAEVTYNGKTYSIEEDTDYTDFSDVSVYVLKWVEKK